MKKFISLILILAMILLPGISAMAEEISEPALTKDIVILFTSDVHCGVDQGFTYTGLYGMKQALSKKNHVALVDNGDSIQGDALGALTKGESIISLMNSLGYDAATLGNHEFDYGTDRLMELAEKASFPYVCANFTYKDELVFEPYIIKEYDGVKVAFVGVATPKTFTISTPSSFQEDDGNYVYGFCEDETGEKLFATVQKAVDAARDEGAQFVIALSHLGIGSKCSPWMSTDLIANTTGIDVLLDGHSHSILEQEKVLNKDRKEVLHSACGTKLQAVGYCRITAEGKISTGLYQWPFKESAVELFGLKNDFTSVVDRETKAINEKLAKVVAHTDVDLITKDPETGVRVVRNLETNLGDLVADAYRSATGADVGMVNSGGIRADLPAGDITMKQIQDCHPFGDTLCMVEANGQQILDALEWSTRNAPEESGGFLQVSGLTFELNTSIKSSCTSDDKGNFTGVAGKYRVSNVLVDGKPLDVKKIYTVASSNYVLKQGGDGTCMFTDDKILLDEIKLDYETLIDYIMDELGGSVGPEYEDIWGQGRIIIKQGKSKASI